MRKRTHISAWTRCTVTRATLNQWATAAPAPLPDDLTGIATDDLVRIIGWYADAGRPDDALNAYTELERREQAAEQAAAAREARIADLVGRGMDPLDAVAEVDGLNPAALRLQAAVAGDRRPGESVTAALRRQYDEWVRLRCLQAERDTCGHLLNAAGKAADVDPRRLFSGPLWLARRWASEDLLRWWEQHGRVTFAQFTHMAAGRATTTQEIQI